jgi:transcriptional regulator with XRE-family HTH domain
MLCRKATSLAVFFRLNFNECVFMEFGTEIRRRRLALGMTLEQLAESSHLTPNYIGTIENGKRDPSLSTVLALAKGLRTSPAELFGGIQDLSAPATEAGLLFDAAAPDVQDSVLQLLRSVSRRRKLAKTTGHEAQALNQAV